MTNCDENIPMLTLRDHTLMRVLQVLSEADGPVTPAQLAEGALATGRCLQIGPLTTEDDYLEHLLRDGLVYRIGFKRLYTLSERGRSRLSDLEQASSQGKPLKVALADAWLLA